VPINQPFRTGLPEDTVKKIAVEKAIEVKSTGLSIAPPDGYFMVTDMYVHPITGKLIVLYNDTALD
jgi:hypothetical protein